MKVLFTTLHAKYVHAALALPYLAAACNIPGVHTIIREFTINETADGILQQLVAEKADVVLFSCYIWNIEQTLKLAADIKLICPGTYIVMGGPEASYGVFELLERNPAVDCIVRGEGETTCRELLEALFCHYPYIPPLENILGITYRIANEIVASPGREPIARLDAVPSPFSARLVDLEKPLVYYETSRGCPFSCAFCMSSLEQGVRAFSMERVRDDLLILMEKGVRTVKLVDRTFNYDAGRANEIWELILCHNRHSRFHFEIAADLLTDANLELLAKVPEDIFRFEIGVQSKDENTLEQVSRKSDLNKLFSNVARLRRETCVTIHLDLVAGLPNENAEGFLQSLQSLFELNPHHIQIEPLKVLKGSAMRKIADNTGYAYSATAPYKILQTPWLNYDEICHIELISRLVDLIYNSGRFNTALTVLAEGSPLADVFDAAAHFWQKRNIALHLSQAGLFETFWRFSEGFLPADRQQKLGEALCYDFCLADYPAAGKLPVFFLDESSNGNAKGKTGDLIRQMGIPEGSKVRTFRRHFSYDFRFEPYQANQVDLLFVYISSPGAGLHTHVHELNQTL